MRWGLVFETVCTELIYFLRSYFYDLDAITLNVVIILEMQLKRGIWHSDLLMVLKNMILSVFVLLISGTIIITLIIMVLFYLQVVSTFPI